MGMRVVFLNVGKPIVWVDQGLEVVTGIFKTPCSEPIYLGKEGLAGDGQADLKHHGGPDKALCVYSLEHYPYWERELGKKLDPGAFGENLTVTGLMETEVCIGDVCFHNRQCQPGNVHR